MPSIKRRYPAARLLIGTYHADPAYRQQMEALAERLDVRENLVLLPVLSEAEMASVYSIADLVVTIPPSDGVPRTLMEAMACGVPSILARLPAYEEFVTDRESAYLVPIAAESVAAAALHLLEDHVLYDRLRRNGLAIAARSFDQREEAAQMERLYRDLLAKPRSHRPCARRAAMLFRLLLHFGLHW
jgi:glycosyltransferase involved in cell wall biosynthesis